MMTIDFQSLNFGTGRGPRLGGTPRKAKDREWTFSIKSSVWQRSAEQWGVRQ